MFLTDVTMVKNELLLEVLIILKWYVLGKRVGKIFFGWHLRFHFDREKD